MNKESLTLCDNLTTQLPDFMKKYILLLCLVLSVEALFGQRLPGLLLMKMKSGEKPKGDAAVLLSPSMNIWQVRFDEAAMSFEEALKYWGRQSGVEIIQGDYQLKLRATTPNDPRFVDQWQYLNNGVNGVRVNADLDADLAWDVTTGGMTALSDTIVVCVIDDGCELSHPDLQGNLWRNWREIPNNGVDDDRNGFVDDYLGWNAYDQNDNVAGNVVGTNGHGTAVAGIIGAKGNNGIGVTGVNWNVKLMIVKGGAITTADAIRAYEYPLTMRRLFNQTNGARGAYIVATNSSWGLDATQPSTQPLWCALYDSLGQEGVLSAVATANDPVDVEVVGDIPSGCGSPYIVAVTNLNSSDFLFSAAHGAISIDLGAYSENCITIGPNGTYTRFGGTSGASPHVAGAIALMYSVQCPVFSAFARNQPAQAALQVKQWLLAGTTFNADLDGRTVTNGRLNLNGAVRQVVNNCPAIATSCASVYNLRATRINANQALVRWQNLYAGASVTLSWQSDNTPSQSVTVATDSFVLQGLQGCTRYRLNVLNQCPQGGSVMSADYYFTTDSCCVPPSNWTVSVNGGQNSTVSWERVLAASAYEVQLRQEGTSIWQTVPVPNGLVANLNNLQNCTLYETRLVSVCGAASSTFSDVRRFVTENCPTCVTASYCDVSGAATTGEWIDSVQIGSYFNASGPNNGYVLFRNTGIQARRGESVPIRLTPAYGGSIYPEFFRVWIDLNQDADFNDSGELMYDAPQGARATIAGFLNIPATAVLGTTRMRISMRWNNRPTNCVSPLYGEVEDYCIEILDSLSGIEDVGLNTDLWRVFPNPTSQRTLNIINDTNPSTTYSLGMFDATGKCLVESTLQTSGATWAIPSQVSSGMYWIRIQEEGMQLPVFKKLVLFGE